MGSCLFNGYAVKSQNMDSRFLKKNRKLADIVHCPVFKIPLPSRALTESVIYISTPFRYIVDVDTI